MSGLRCRPGDLAVVVKALSIPEHVGRFVIVERLADSSEYASGYVNGAVWAVRSAAGGLLKCWFPSGRIAYVPVVFCADAHLRPIRPNEGEDESLSWAKPRIQEFSEG